MMSKENIVSKLIGIDREYITVDPNKYTKGHGGSLSIKIVLPSYCQAHCAFCFNKFTINTQKHNYDKFLKNLPKTLDMILNTIKGRPITLDITGNEPTFDIKFFSKFLKILKIYKHKVDKIVLTTNGYNLQKCLDNMAGIIDIVNISLHHYDYNERQNIFKTSYIPDDEQLKNIIKKLKHYDISCTSVAVLYKKIENFKEFYNNFINWSNELGFKNTRMRSNFCSSEKFIDDIINVKMNCERIDEVGGLTTKIIVDKDTGYQTYILKGVPDLTEFVVGAELVIDDDGFCYVDYNKRYPVDNLKIKYFNKFYIFK